MVVVMETVAMVMTMAIVMIVAALLLLAVLVEVQHHTLYLQPNAPNPKLDSPRHQLTVHNLHTAIPN